LVHVHLRELVDVGQREFGLIAEPFLERFQFKPARFAVAGDKEVAAAATGIEEGQLAELLMEFLQPRAAGGGAVGLAVFKLGAEFVEKQGADDI
jgi:hypothetical protein